MKPKALSTKLTLNKETISDLSNEKMQNVLGGTNDTTKRYAIITKGDITFCPIFTCGKFFCAATRYPDMPC